MNKCIFLAEDEAKIREVYSGETILKRMNVMGISLNNLYSTKDFGKRDFSSVEFVFSTWSMPKITSKQIKEIFPSLKAVFYAAGTVKYFARPFFENGIEVFSADYANAIAVSDFVFAEIILAAKGFYQAQRLYKQLRYAAGRECAMQHVGNYEATIGIIGAGKIGTKVIDKLSTRDFRILVCDPVITNEQALKMGCEKVDINEIFKKCDVISNHLPDIDSTEKLLNYELFKHMKNHSTFINTGRGRQVDESGLIKALKKNKSICAVLDVTSREPMLPISRMYRMKNIFMTPHIAGSTNQEQRRMASYMLDAYEDYIVGKKSEYCVDPKKIDSMT